MLLKSNCGQRLYYMTVTILRNTLLKLRKSETKDTERHLNRQTVWRLQRYENILHLVFYILCCNFYTNSRIFLLEFFSLNNMDITFCRLRWDFSFGCILWPCRYVFDADDVGAFTSPLFHFLLQRLVKILLFVGNRRNNHIIAFVILFLCDKK